MAWQPSPTPDPATTLENLAQVKADITEAKRRYNRTADSVELVVVSKTFDADAVEPVLKHGHRIFGENRVQEAQGKWPELKEKYPDTELHLIGPLQSNKAADAVALFDVIETVDREKIARALKKEMQRQDVNRAVYVQVNTGDEPQKAGLSPSETVAFVRQCIDDIGLNVIGLMCIPPADQVAAPHFALLRKLALEAGVTRLSMGMSADYDMAIMQGATLVRVGSAIFGGRAATH